MAGVASEGCADSVSGNGTVAAAGVFGFVRGVRLPVAVLALEGLPERSIIDMREEKSY